MNLNNISQIRCGGSDITLAKLNGDILYKKGDTPVEPIGNPYYVEYTVDTGRTMALNGGDSDNKYKYGLPRIYSTASSYTYPTSDMVEITLLDGTITNDLSTKSSNVSKVKVYYPEETVAVKFYGSSTYDSIFKTLDYIKTDNFTNMSGMFHHCSSLISLDLSNFNTSNVTDMSSMFYECSKLTSLDVSNFNTSKVTNMSHMFQKCYNLTSLDLSSFNTSKVTNMTSMFYDCRFLMRLNLSNWDTSKASSRYSMFYYCNSLVYLDLSGTSDETIIDIVNYLPTKTSAKCGEVVVPETISESVSEKLINKYWKPIGGIEFNPTSVEIIVDLEEIVGIGERSKVYYVSYSPWYSNITNTVELISSDDSIAYINENNEIITASYGSVEIYVRLKSSGEIISNVVTINVYENDPYPYEIKFKADLTTTSAVSINVNGSDIALSSMKYNANTKVYSYDVGEKLTSLKFNNNNNKFSGLEFIKIDTSNVTSMKEMFKSLTALKTLDISKFNTSNVTDMSSMFYQCSNLASLDLSSFNTSKVTNMSYMFNQCYNLTSLDLSSFNTSNVTNMSYMFQYCSSLNSLDLTSFNTSNMTDIHGMFQNCTSLTSLDLSNWDISKVKTFYSLLGDMPVDIDFHYDGNNYQKWTLTEKQCGYEGFFPWNKPTNLTYSEDYYASYEVERLSVPLNYGSLRKMGIPLVSINGGKSYELLRVKITLLDGTITDDITTPCDLISEVKVLYPVNADSLIFGSETENMYNKDGKYYGNAFNFVSYINTSNFTNMTGMFKYCNLLYYLNTSGWDTSNVTDMSYMFQNCTSLTSLDLSNFNTSNVISMYCMFYTCSSLSSLNLSNWNNSNVTDMSNMFYDCSSLTSLDLSNFDTSNVTSMSGMFYYCPSLTSLDVSNFDTSNVYDMSYMFYNCNASIYGGYKFAIRGSCNNMFEYFSGSIYDIGYGEVNSALYMFANSNIDDYTFSNTFYYNCNFSGCSNMSYMFYNCTNLSSFYFNDSSYHSTQSLNDVSYMFAGCTNLYELYINYMNTYNVYNYEGMFADVSDSCNIYVGSDFTLTESDTGFNGYFQHY